MWRMITDKTFSYKYRTEPFSPWSLWSSPFSLPFWSFDIQALTDDPVDGNDSHPTRPQTRCCFSTKLDGIEDQVICRSIRPITSSISPWSIWKTSKFEPTTRTNLKSRTQLFPKSSPTPLPQHAPYTQTKDYMKSWGWSRCISKLLASLFKPTKISPLGRWNPIYHLA